MIYLQFLLYYLIITIIFAGLIGYVMSKSKKELKDLERAKKDCLNEIGKALHFDKILTALERFLRRFEK